MKLAYKFQATRTRSFQVPPFFIWTLGVYWNLPLIVTRSSIFLFWQLTFLKVCFYQLTSFKFYRLYRFFFFVLNQVATFHIAFEKNHTFLFTICRKNKQGNWSEQFISKLWFLKARRFFRHVYHLRWQATVTFGNNFSCKGLERFTVRSWIYSGVFKVFF